MANKKKKAEGLSEEEILAHIKMLSEQAQIITGKQEKLPYEEELGDEDIDTSFNLDNLNDTADPDKSHMLYYTMMGAMKRNLPKGKGENEKLRRIIYDEKSLFLNRGKDKDEKGVKHSDERQSYISNYLEVAVEVVKRWITQGSDPFDLFMAFRELNKKYGYIDAEKKK